MVNRLGSLLVSVTSVMLLASSLTTRQNTFKRVDLNGTLQVGAIKRTIKRSLIDCADSCTENNQCSSIVFQSSSKVCRQFSKQFFPGRVNVSHESNEEKYYWRYGDGCPWMSYEPIGDGTCLGVRTELVSFYNASTACQREGGRLLIILDRDHMSIILDLLNATGHLANYYVGFVGDSNGNHWWLDGSDIDPSLWKSGRPSNFPNQLCGVASLRDPITSPDAGLNDLPCEDQRKYLCQLPAL